MFVSQLLLVLLSLAAVFFGLILLFASLKIRRRSVRAHLLTVAEATGSWRLNFRGQISGLSNHAMIETRGMTLERQADGTAKFVAARRPSDEAIQLLLQ